MEKHSTRHEAAAIVPDGGQSLAQTRLLTRDRLAWLQRNTIAAATGMPVVWQRPWMRVEEGDAVLTWSGDDAPLRHARGSRVDVSPGVVAGLRPSLDMPLVSLLITSPPETRSRAFEDVVAGSAVAFRALSADEEARAHAAISLLCEKRLAQFNHRPDILPAELERLGDEVVAVVLDEPASGDNAASLARAREMVRSALTENPGRYVAVVAASLAVARAAAAGLQSDDRIVCSTDSCNPWALIDIACRIYANRSEVGLLGLLAGRPVAMFSPQVYTGLGLTDDRFAGGSQGEPVDIAQLATHLLFDAPRYVCPYDNRPTTFEDAVDKLAFLRDRFHDNDRRSVCIGVTRWKRGVIAPLLDGVAGPPLYRRSVRAAVASAQQCGGQIVTWATRAPPRLAGACKAADVPLVRIEDGFIRSVGLGAAYVKGASIALDRRSIYYDAHNPNDLEIILETMDFDADTLARARRLREEIVRLGLTKYNVGEARSFAMPAGQEKILVPGQVADDASIRLTSTHLQSGGATGADINLELLKAARRRNPHAYIVFKPHPDVEAGLRRGRTQEHQLLRYADKIARDSSILPLIESVDCVETLTSLAGFEALLRGKPVTCHGLPFYSGWGLTDDMIICNRRTRLRDLDELVAAALLVYPRYVDPLSLLPCSVELVLQRLSNR